MRAASAKKERGATATFTVTLSVSVSFPVSVPYGTALADGASQQRLHVWRGAP
jgi:hypothetical protein